jgi:hypothetical protein
MIPIMVIRTKTENLVQIDAKSLQVVEGMGVFNPNRRLPLHRWYPFVEGFSAELVNQALDQDEHGEIFDPFGGSGTTALTASLRGRRSSFTEVNPFLAWVAQVKVNKVKEFLDIGADPKVISNFKFSRSVSNSALRQNAFWEINEKRDFLNEENFKALISFMHQTDSLSEPYRSIVRLAGATSILPSSNMIRRTDLRRRTKSDKAPGLFVEIVKERLRIFADDLIQLSSTELETTDYLGNDARQNWTSPNKIDLIVTSPPYLNGTNYCRNTKMELFACGFFNSESELQELRDRSIMAGINNVSSRKQYDTTKLPKVNKIINKLISATYDKRIPKMVNGYFVDMGMMFSSTYSNSSPNALFLLDIGDSKFANVHIDTPDLLREVASDTGWDFKRLIQLRSRRSFDGSVLSQVLLEFRRF